MPLETVHHIMCYTVVHGTDCLVDGLTYNQFAEVNNNGVNFADHQ